MIINWLYIACAVVLLFVFCGSGMWFMYKWRYIQMTPTHPDHELVAMLYDWLMPVTALLIIAGVIMFFGLFWEAFEIVSP